MGVGEATMHRAQARPRGEPQQAPGQACKDCESGLGIEILIPTLWLSDCANPLPGVGAVASPLGCGFLICVSRQRAPKGLLSNSGALWGPLPKQVHFCCLC